MSLHARFRTHTATVERASRTSDGQGGWTKAFATVGQVVGSLQPAGAAEAEAAGQERALARWIFYCDPGVDVQRDDELTIDGQRYLALSVGRWEAAGSIDHWAVQLEEVQRGR